MSAPALCTVTEVGYVPALGYTRITSLLGLYGGGDDIRFSRVILAVGLPIENIPIDLRKRIVLAARQAAARFPASEAAVVRLSPEFDAGDESGSALTWEFKFTMLSHVYGAEGLPWNVMCHGFLFNEVVNEPGRLGCSKWPLVGLFDAVGLDGFADASAVPAGVGIDCLHPADQHVHLVDEFGETWHIGSDMSKCVLTEPSGIAKAWAVCVDTETRRVEVSFWFVLPGDAEGAGDAVARESADGLDAAALLEGLTTKLAVLGAAPFIDEITALFQVSASTK